MIYIYDMYIYIYYAYCIYVYDIYMICKSILFYIFVLFTYIYIISHKIHINNQYRWIRTCWSALSNCYHIQVKWCCFIPLNSNRQTLLKSPLSTCIYTLIICVFYSSKLVGAWEIFPNERHFLMRLVCSPWSRASLGYVWLHHTCIKSLPYAPYGGFP